jgi:hypothetical protein
MQTPCRNIELKAADPDPSVSIAFDRLMSEEMLASLHEEAHEACFIANSVSCDVRVELEPATSANGLPPISGRGHGERA